MKQAEPSMFSILLLTSLSLIIIISILYSYHSFPSLLVYHLYLNTSLSSVPFFILIFISRSSILSDLSSFPLVIILLNFFHLCKIPTYLILTTFIPLISSYFFLTFSQSIHSFTSLSLSSVYLLVFFSQLHTTSFSIFRS